MTLSGKPGTWTAFVEMVRASEELPADFMNDRNDAPDADRDLF